MPRDGDGVYTRKDRPGYWISWKDADDRRRRKKVKAPNMAEAKKLLSGYVSREEKIKAHGVRPAAGNKTFADVAQEYLAFQKKRISAANYERERGILEDHLKPFFAGELSAIRRSAVHQYITARSAEVSSATVTKELNVLKHLLWLAVDELEYLPANPATRVKAPKSAPGRVRYLQPSELRAVLAAAPLWLRPIIALAVGTGMRRSEILKLRWLDLDLAHSRTMLPQTKNGEGRIVYLNRLAVSAIESLSVSEKTKPSDRLFPGLAPEWVSVAFLRVCRGLKIADFRFHDLRHTAASWLRMRGADIHTVAQLLGHKDLRMAARYQHLSPGFLSEAVGQLDTAFAECHQYVTSKNALPELTEVSA